MGGGAEGGGVEAAVETEEVRDADDQGDLGWPWGE